MPIPLGLVDVPDLAVVGGALKVVRLVSIVGHAEFVDRSCSEVFDRV